MQAVGWVCRQHVGCAWRATTLAHTQLVNAAPLNPIPNPATLCTPAGTPPRDLSPSDFRLPADVAAVAREQRRALLARGPPGDSYAEAAPQQGSGQEAAQPTGVPAATAQEALPARSRKLFSTPGAPRAALLPGAASAGAADRPLFGVTYSWRRAELCDGGARWVTLWG